MDSLEILKEQQHRIHERQMRELLMRQNLGNNTYSIARLQQQRHETTQPEATPVIERIFGLTTPKTPTTPAPSLQMPTPLRPVPPFPKRQQPQPISIASDVEEISSGEMLTARDNVKTEAEESQSEPKQAVLRTITYRTNVATLSEKALKFQLFIRGVDVDDPETGVETRPRGSRGSGMTPKQFYTDLAQKMVQDGRWQTKVSEELLKKRIQDYRNKNEPRSSKN